MTNPTPEGMTPSSGELRAALADLIDAIDGSAGSSDSGELRRLAVEKMDGIDRRARAASTNVDEAGVDGEEHDDGPIDALRDALHRFETDHPVLTKAINDVSHFLSGMGI